MTIRQFHTTMLMNHYRQSPTPASRAMTDREAQAFNAWWKWQVREILK